MHLDSERLSQAGAQERGHALKAGRAPGERSDQADGRQGPATKRPGNALNVVLARQAQAGVHLQSRFHSVRHAGGHDTPSPAQQRGGAQCWILCLGVISNTFCCSGPFPRPTQSARRPTACYRYGRAATRLDCGRRCKRASARYSCKAGGGLAAHARSAAAAPGTWPQKLAVQRQL